VPLSLPCLPSWALAPDPVRPCALHRRAARQRPAASARAACGLPRWRGVAAGRPAPPCLLAAWPRAATVPALAVAGRTTQLPVPASATCRSRFSSRDFEEWGTVNGREREGLGSEQAGGRGSLLWAVIRVPKLVVYGLDHLFGLNLSSGIYLMYILIVNIVCIHVLWMYILIHFQKKLGIPGNTQESSCLRQCLLPSFPEAGGAALPGAGGCSCNGQDAAAQIAEAVCMCFAAQSVPWQVRRTHSF